LQNEERAARAEMDVIVRGALIADGSGAPAFEGDLAISNDVIEAVGDIGARRATAELDGSGLVAAPGFIDMHSHSDYTLPTDPRSLSKVSQGVTTEVVGNCGDTPAPLEDEHREEWILSKAFTPGELSWDWNSFGGFLEKLGQRGLGVNVFPLVGQGAIRNAVMGTENRRPSAKEAVRMEELLARSMAEGALGLSTGLLYPPGAYSDTAELVRLAEVASQAGRFYFSHIRGEGSTLLAAIEEAIAVGRKANLPVQISHLKALGRKNWAKYDEALGLVDEARAEGLDVVFDLYPYVAANTVVTALLPTWVLADGISATLARLQEPRLREQIGAEMLELEILSGSEWHEIVIGGCRAYPDYAGKSVRQLADEAGEMPLDWVLDFLVRSQGAADIIIFTQSEDNVCKGLSHPVATVGTDGLGLAVSGPLAEGRPHPRSYGTYPRVLGHYVRDVKLFSLEEAVRKMSGGPAERLRLRNRGRLRPGFKADIVLFNADTIDDMCEYAQPPRYARGIAYVLVNGKVVFDHGEHTGALPGRILGMKDLLVQQAH
jgi:N-acyl-D-amino-acid deacylase